MAPSSELTGAAQVGMTPVLIETPFGAAVRDDAKTGWSGRAVTELDELHRLLAELETC